MARLALAAFALSSASSALAAPDDLLGKFGLEGAPFKGSGGSGKKRRSDPSEPKDATPQAPGDPSQPILPVNTALQLPDLVVPRSANVAPRRRSLLVTDGAVYQRVDPPNPLRWWSKLEPAIPYAYIIAPSGEVTFKMEFGNRASPALPYGIAEDPRVRARRRGTCRRTPVCRVSRRTISDLPPSIALPQDGRVAVTFYQSQTDSIEVWQPPDLSWKLTYHDLSLKP
jgi:hypothetical protein